jgi:DNA-binding NarL/FixJ family response regulator
MTGLLLSDDLIFASRITGTGRDFGFAIRVAKSAGFLLALASEQAPACVIVDLSNPGLQIADMVTQLKRMTPPPRIVAYGSHVDTATLKAARAAGCDEVMPRSQFVELLPKNLGQWMQPLSE